MTPLFLIQSHNNPDHLARLTRVILRGCPRSIVLVSHDARGTPISAALFGRDSRVAIVDGFGGRGNFDILDGYLAALGWLRDHKVDYDWLTNLSGQDYPVSSLAAFADDLSRATHDGYLHHFDAIAQDARTMAPMSWPPEQGYERYCFQYVKYKERLGLLERAALRAPRLVLKRWSSLRIDTAYGLMIGRRAARTPFTPQLRCYAGSYWHTIRRHCADYLLHFADSRPEVVEYMRHVLIPDECFVQTILVNNPDLRFVNDNRRYFDMHGSRLGHPRVMTEADLPHFVGKRYVFARKFDPASGSALFDLLDQYALEGAPRQNDRARYVDALS